MNNNSSRNKNKKPLDIAVVGIGGIFPGAENLNDFWKNINDAKSASAEVPEGRWPESVGNFHSNKAGEFDKVVSRKCCFLRNIPSDFSGLNIDESEIKKLDPLFSITLQAGRDAFKDANAQNIDPEKFPVILANIVLPTDTASAITVDVFTRILEARAAGSNLSLDELTKSLKTAPENRFSAELPGGLLARALKLKGGAFTLDAACASSLYALKLASEELASGRADAVLTGGVSRPSSQFTQMGFSQLRALSPSGVCAPFDKKADGLVVGEGAGIFVLKRLEDALKDKNNIYAVIKGIGLANDVGGSLLAPDTDGQVRAMHDAYAQAGWTPEDVQLIECHGTGTPKGDAVEFASLRKLWEGRDLPKNKCVIGSVKSNVGHLLTGAGAAGLMKLLLSLKNETLPPEANFETPDPVMKMEESPFTVLKSPIKWEPLKKGQPRRCALSAFGFGGIDGHVLLEEWNQSSHKSTKKSAAEKPVEIAIVGIGTRAGRLLSLDSFQKAVFEGKPVKNEISDSRHPFKLNEKWVSEGNYFDELDLELGKFRISPAEIPEILPQQLLMLQTVDDALKGIKHSKEMAKDWGVYIGIGLDLESTNFAVRWKNNSKTASLKLSSKPLNEVKDAATPPLSNTRTVGSLGGIVASRVAREFHVGGPSHTFSSGENSGLSALESGMRALQRNEIDTALVGAIDLSGDLRNIICVDSVKPFSRKGGSVPFDNSADGSFPGEGAVSVVLKRLDDAIRDGDIIYSVIKGIGHSNAVEKNAPDKSSILSAMKKAYAEAELSPEITGLIEANGSGIPAEDLEEAKAINEFFPKKNVTDANRFKTNDQLCALSSAKSVIGYTGAASGLFSVAKASLSIFNEILPAFPGMISPIEPLEDRKDFLFTPDKPQYWLRNKVQGPRTASVNAFSVDGTCYNLVLQGFENDEKLNPNAIEKSAKKRLFPVNQSPETVFIISAESNDQLLKKLSALQNSFKSFDSLRESAFAWWQGNKQKKSDKVCISFVAQTFEEAAKRIAICVSHITNSPGKAFKPDLEINEKVFYTPTPLSGKGKIAFMFPGSGNHYLGMGVELGRMWPEHLRKLDKEFDLLAAQFAPKYVAPWRLSWEKGWEKDAEKAMIDDHNSLVFSHVSCCALVSDVVRSFGIEPEIVMGYSLGETAGNFSTRTWQKRDEMVRRMRKSNLFTSELIGEYNSARKHWGLKKSENVEWILGLINCPAKDVEQAIKEFDQAYILIVNTLDECIIGGNKPQVEELVKKLNKPFFPIDGVSSVHCPAAIPSSEDYRNLHVYDCTPMPRVKYISSGKGVVFTPEKEASADSILAQCIGKIDFPKCVETAYAEGARIFLEIGPRSSMTRMTNKILGDRPHFARSALMFGQSEQSTLLKFLAEVASHNITVDLAPLYVDLINKNETAPERKRPIIKVPVGRKIELKATAPVTKPISKPAAPVQISQPKPAITKPQPVQLPPKQAIVIPPKPMKEILPMQEKPEAVQIAYQSNNQTPQNSQASQNQMPMSNEDAFKISLLQQWQNTQMATSSAHEAFLKLANSNLSAQMQLLQQQIAIMEGHAPNAAFQFPTTISGSAPAENFISAPKTVVHADPNKMPPKYEGPLFMDREKSMEYAIGKIGKALGDYFAPIDQYPTRVRLPDIPLNFVDRMTLVEGEKGSLGKGRCVTQHDVYPDAWYLDNYCMPTGLAVEAGQADLFLSGWLGIDFKTKGLAKYRLLDAVVTFHGPLPRPGDVVNYDIKVDRFIRQADTYLFFFEFDGTVDGKQLITMRKGCAGFFTDKQLADGKGIVLTEEDTRLEPKQMFAGKEILPEMTIESYSDDRLDALRAGNLEAAFGSQFAGIDIIPQGIPSGMMKMIDRITEINPTGGRFGLGQIKAEIDIPVDPWFLTSHFSDDQVMPGTLMYESCMQSLRVFLLRMGWVSDYTKSAFEPIPEVQSQLRCRGQVIPGTKKALYEITIKELGYNPEPYAIADALMFADGNRIVQVLNMSIRLTGTNKTEIENLWLSRRGNQPVVAAPQAVTASVDPEMLPAIYTGQQILEYAIGKPSLCFGDKLKPFDSDRFLARLPNPPYLLVDRITAVDAEPFIIKTGGHVQGQFDIKPDAWFFKANRQTSIPFAIFLEFPLQVCGWYSCFMGSAFQSDKALHYRNLDGKATLYEDINVNSGTLTADIVSTKAANSAGMLIQSFKFTVKKQGRLIYDGETTFGFFAEEALANQIGIRGEEPYKATEAEKSRHVDFPLAVVAPLTPDDNNVEVMNGLTLPGKALLMLDNVSLFVPDGGPNGLGVIQGKKKVDPSEWFFKAHFYQDPVIPGSLGLESFLQLLKVAAIHRWGTELKDRACHFEPIALGVEHKWTYRGQVIPKDDMVTVDAVVTKIDDSTHTIFAEGYLQVDGRIVYGMKDFALRVVIDD